MARTSRTRLSLLAAVAATALALIVPAASSARAGDPYLAGETQCPGSSSLSLSASEQSSVMLCELNFARAQAGLTALSPAPELGASARAKAADILRCDDFTHSACGTPWMSHIRESGYVDGCWAAGENLAWGQSTTGAPGAIMDAWLGSPAHRVNILSKDFSEVGIAQQSGVLGGYDDVAVWVTHFGSHCDQTSSAKTPVVHAAELRAGDAAATGKSHTGLGGAQVALRANRHSHRHGAKHRIAR